MYTIAVYLQTMFTEKNSSIYYYTCLLYEYVFHWRENTLYADSVI